jgi:hypothetical protein
MTDYCRNFIAGGSFFFTVNLAERRLSLLTEHIDELRTAFRETRRDHPFTIEMMRSASRRSSERQDKDDGYRFAPPILRAHFDVPGITAAAGANPIGNGAYAGALAGGASSLFSTTPAYGSLGK